MIESIHFHTDLYRRDALEFAAEQYHGKARIELADSGTHVVAHVEPLSDSADLQALRDEFCNEAFSATARRVRDLAAERSRTREAQRPATQEPPWALLSPFSEGAPLGLGWTLESLSPVRRGAATMVLRHEQQHTARIALRRNSGAPLGVAHTDHLDFMLMNGGSGETLTEQSIGRVLRALADTLRSEGNNPPGLLAALLPHAEGRAPQPPPPANGGAMTHDAVLQVAPHIDVAERSIAFDFEETGTSRLALYDAVLALADRCYVFLTRPAENRVAVQLKARDPLSAEALAALAEDAARALAQVGRAGAVRAAAPASIGLPGLARTELDLDALVVELAAGDPATMGLGFQPERGPGHENLRVLNIRGTGACNSECAFCIEKFNPT